MCHLLVGICTAVYQSHILLNRTGEYLEVRESAVLVGNGLEDHSNGRAVGRAVDLDQLALLVLADLNRCFVGRRHVIGNALEQCVGTDTGCSGAAEYRCDNQILDALTDAGDQLFVRELFACEVALHQLFGQLCNVLAQGCAVLIDTVYHVLRNRDLDALGAFHAVCLADNAVDNADGITIALEDGHDDRTNRNAELLLQLMQRSIVIGVFLIDLGDVEHAGHLALFRTRPCLLGADTGAGLTGCNDQRGLGHAQCLIDFVFEIEEARGIEQVDLAVVPYDRCNGGRDGELALDLFGVEITYGISIGYLTDAVGNPGGE